MKILNETFDIWSYDLCLIVENKYTKWNGAFCKALILKLKKVKK